MSVFFRNLGNKWLCRFAYPELRLLNTWLTKPRVFTHQLDRNYLMGDHNIMRNGIKGKYRIDCDNAITARRAVEGKYTELLTRAYDLQRNCNPINLL